MNKGKDRDILEHIMRHIQFLDYPQDVISQLSQAKSLEEFRKSALNIPGLLEETYAFASYDVELGKLQVQNNLSAFLDKLGLGVFILNAQGVYIYANDAMATITGIPKSAFPGTRVKEKATNFDVLISDIVFREKRTVTMYQDVSNLLTGRQYRQLVTQYPILDGFGEVAYIIAVVEKTSDLNLRLGAAQKNQTMSYSIGVSPALKRDPSIVAHSPQMSEIMTLLLKISSVNSAVLIRGESGVGKEVVVRTLHKFSNRSDKPFVDINCAALPEALLEAELFGYEKGAFTGADSKGKVGLIERANSGFLFLDEINSMPLPIQSKLLRVLETKTIRRLGGHENIPVDFRIVSATNQDLETLCEQQSFREDLYYRLNVIPITIPPLRERKEDILPLVDMFLQEFEGLYDKYKTFSPYAKEQLLNYSWPGNVRELRNFVERIVVTSSDADIEIQKISDAMFSGSVSTKKQGADMQRVEHVPYTATPHFDFQDENFSLEGYIAHCEAEAIKSALAAAKSTYKAAKLLKVNQATVVRKRQKYGL